VCSTLLPSQLHRTSSQPTADPRNAVQDLTSSSGKFMALTDLLEYKLNDIAEGLNRRKFVDFTAAEMIKLVKALFEDTPRRQTLLNSIEALPTK
jgi:hypothetical protein